MKQINWKRIRLAAILTVLLIILIIASTNQPAVAATKAKTIQVSAKVEWVSTGLYINASSQPVTLNISTKGGVLTGPVNIYGGTPMGPEGSEYICYDQPENGFYCAMNAQPWGRLVGKIGAFGEPFDIGDATSITIYTSGFLYLTVNDFLGTYYDNRGAFTVVLK